MIAGIAAIAFVSTHAPLLTAAAVSVNVTGVVLAYIRQ